MLVDILQKLAEGKKVLVIMRGVPGSGKSTAARSLRDELNRKIILETGYCPKTVICSTDDVNEMLNGSYIFEPEMLGLYHGINYEIAKDCMRHHRIHVVIIDNTNIKHKDYKRYVHAAECYGYEVVEYKVGKTDFDEDSTDVTPTMYATRNTHGVPLEVILRMGKQFQE